MERSTWTCTSRTSMDTDWTGTMLEGGQQLSGDTN
jgi:hypothetical protein